MTQQGVGVESSRQERRKAATRANILRAADKLFSRHGYAEISIEDIADEADVAVRTIYLHFPSKAGVMLAHFDSWLDAFVAGVLERPHDERAADTMRAVIAKLEADGWENRKEGDHSRPHPMMEHLVAGSLDIAGHVLQQWIRAQTAIVKDMRERGNYAADSLVPQARASALFAAWMATVTAINAHYEGAPLSDEVTTNGLAQAMVDMLVGGSL